MQADHIVLAVDDDQDLLSVIEAFLRRGGYSPITATGPSEALKKSREFSGGIHLLLTDITMPEMDGLTLAEHIVAERAHIHVLLMSGLPVVSSRLPLVKKPFSKNVLLEQIANVIDGPLPLPSDIFADRKPSRDSDVATLERESNEALCRYLEVSRRLLDVSADVPSGIPATDGVLQLQLRAREQQRAFEEYQKALGRLASYIESLKG